MVALYRSGCQADALAAYQRARAVLAEELGLEPGGELRRLEAAILDHSLDPDVDPPVPHAIRPTPVRYARTLDDVAIAYQMAGDGHSDVLAIPGYVHHLDIWWSAPTDRLVRRLTAMGRLVVFDPRGMGLSDRPDAVNVDDPPNRGTPRSGALTLSDRPDAVNVDDWMIDALAVRALIIHGGYARRLAAPDYDIGWTQEIIDDCAAHVERGWGTGVALSSAAPSLASDPAVRAYYARYQRLSASPSAAVRHLRASAEADVRHLLGRIRVPTLVLHAERDVLVPVAQGRFIADNIEGAEFVTLDSDVHLICVSDVLEQVADHLEAFLARVGATAAAPVGTSGQGTWSEPLA